MTTVGDIKTQIQAYLNDDSEEQFTDTVMEFAIKSNARAIANQVSRLSTSQLDRELSLTTDANGELDLSAYDILRLKQVALERSNFSIPLSEMRNKDKYFDLKEAHDLRLTVQLAPVIPATDGGTILWDGSSTASIETYDMLLVIRCVTQLSTIDNEMHALAKAQEASLWDAIRSEPGLSSGQYLMMPDNVRYSTRYPYVYSQAYVIEGNDKLQLVYN